MPDYSALLESVGIKFASKYDEKPGFGAGIQRVNNKWLISSNPHIGSSAYQAGLSKKDEIVSIDGKLTNNKLNPNSFFLDYKIGDQLKVVYNRYGIQYKTEMTLEKNNNYQTQLISEPSKKVLSKQNDWLNSKVK